MARKRSIKPEFFDDDDISALSFGARLLYIGLWLQMDRNGLVEDSPRALRAKVFPREDHSIQDIENWRDELCKPGVSGRPRLIKLKWGGKALLLCPTFTKHQKIHHDEPARFDISLQELENAVKSENPHQGGGETPTKVAVRPPSTFPSLPLPLQSSTAHFPNTPTSPPEPETEPLSPVLPFADANLIEKIYRAYPKRRGPQRKPDGVKRIKKLNKGEVEDFRNAVENYAHHCREHDTDPRFIMQFGTFANENWREWVTPEQAQTRYEAICREIFLAKPPREGLV